MTATTDVILIRRWLGSSVSILGFTYSSTKFGETNVIPRTANATSLSKGGIGGNGGGGGGGEVIFVAMASGLCAAMPYLVRSKSNRFQTSLDVLKNQKEVAGMIIENSSSWAENLVLMMELRKKIMIFRDIIDLPPCIGSGPITELMMGTVEDLHNLYPNFVHFIANSDVENNTLYQALEELNKALTHVRSFWAKNHKWIASLTNNNDGSLEDINLEQMSKRVLGNLDFMIKVAKQMFDVMDEDERNNENSKQGYTIGGSLSESYSDNKVTCCSPDTPTSEAPELNLSKKLGEFATVSYSQPLLLPLRLQAVGKLNTTSFQILTKLPAQGSIILNEKKRAADERDLELQETKRASIELPATDPVKESRNYRLHDSSHLALSSPIPMHEARTPAAVPPPPPLAPFPSPPLQVPTNITAEPPPPTPLPSQPSQVPTNVTAPPPPSPNPPAKGSPPPPPLTMSMMQMSKEAVPPPPPMPMPEGAVPAPPMPMTKGAPAPPMPLIKGAAPPPPPPGATKSLLAKKGTSKLKRSSQMGNLYRLLKGKVEGSSLNGKQCQGKKSVAGGSSGKGMADALAEMTKRSAYFQQIEEDVQKHGKAIMELKSVIMSFQTKDMAELLRFHNHIEQHLEKLTDETQVLARFEGFPEKKLETLRTAAALYSKLEQIHENLRNWKVVLPLNQLLDRVESYYNKIKGEIEALERSKDEECKRFQSHNIHFDFAILVRIKESMVDLSSSCMELALKERREVVEDHFSQSGTKADGKKKACVKMLWRAFQLAFRIYSFAGGQDDRADRLSKELAQEIETDPQHQT